MSRKKKALIVLAVLAVLVAAYAVYRSIDVRLVEKKLRGFQAERVTMDLVTIGPPPTLLPEEVEQVNECLKQVRDIRPYYRILHPSTWLGVGGGACDLYMTAPDGRTLTLCLLGSDGHIRVSGSPFVYILNGESFAGLEQLWDSCWRLIRSQDPRYPLEAAS